MLEIGECLTDAVQDHLPGHGIPVKIRSGRPRPRKRRRSSSNALLEIGAAVCAPPARQASPAFRLDQQRPLVSPTVTFVSTAGRRIRRTVRSPSTRWQGMRIGKGFAPQGLPHGLRRSARLRDLAIGPGLALGNVGHRPPCRRIRPGSQQSSASSVQPGSSHRPGRWSRAACPRLSAGWGFVPWWRRPRVHRG